MVEIIFFLLVFGPPAVLAFPVYYFFPKLGKLWSYLTALIIFFVIAVLFMGLASMRIPKHSETVVPAGR
jgi:hypothetical protein